MKALITGVSGFVGSQLASHLLTQGWEVVGVDLRQANSPCAKNVGYHFIALDITDTSKVEELPWEDVDVFYHLAAAGVKVATREWPLCVHVNLVGTAAIMGVLMQRAYAQEKVPKIVYTKSYYEDHIDQIPAFKDNAYVMSKVAATRWLEALAPAYTEAIIIAKVFQVYGPGDDTNNVLSYAAHALKAGHQATFGSGKSLRDWIYIEDFIQGLIACGGDHGPGLHRFDLGSGERRSIREMVERIAEITEADPSLLTFDPSKDRGDAEIEDWALQSPLGWQIKKDMIAGLSDLVEFI